MQNSLYADNYQARRLETLLRAKGRCEGIVGGKRCPNRLGTFKISHAHNPCFESLHVVHVNDDPENPNAELKALCPACHMRLHRQPGSNGKAAPRKQGYKVIGIAQLLLKLTGAGFSTCQDEEGRTCWQLGPLEAVAADPVEAIIMAMHWLGAEVGNLQAELARVKVQLAELQSSSQQPCST